MPLSNRTTASNNRVSARNLFQRDSPTRKFGKKQWLKIYGPAKGKHPRFDSSPTKAPSPEQTRVKRAKYGSGSPDVVPSAKSDSESEDEFLIDFGALSSPLRRLEDANEPAKQSDRETNPSQNSPKEPLPIATATATATENDVILKIANDGLLATIHLSDADQVQRTREKYSKYQFPEPTTLKSELKRNTERYLPLIKRILHGKHRVSIFYDMAKQKQTQSEHQTITNIEKLDIDWRQFCGGYYGFKRQYYIASVIENSLSNTLRNAESRNRTIEYWTIPSFTAYVLANEIIIRLVMKDMDYKYDDAEALVLETSEYGYVVADTSELEDDVHSSDSESEDGASPKRTHVMSVTNSMSTTGTLLEELYNSD